jgi:hypothetical protein
MPADNILNIDKIMKKHSIWDNIEKKDENEEKEESAKYKEVLKFQKKKKK